MKTNQDYAFVGLVGGFFVGLIVATFYLQSKAHGYAPAGLAFIPAIVYAVPASLLGLVVSFVIKYLKGPNV